MITCGSFIFEKSYEMPIRLILEGQANFIKSVITSIYKSWILTDVKLCLNSKLWFGVKTGKIKISEMVWIIKKIQLFKKLKKSKLHIDKDIYNPVRYKVRKMIFNKKRSLFLKES